MKSNIPLCGQGCRCAECRYDRRMYLADWRAKQKKREGEYRRARLEALARDFRDAIARSAA